MARLSKDDYYLRIAKDVAMRSTCLRRNYGAVIVNHDRIVSTGYNGAPRGEVNCCDRGTCPRIENNVPHNSGTYSDCCSVHAEQNAIIHATFTDMQGATLYLYGVNPESGETISDISPCPICSRMIKNAGISRVVAPTWVPHYDTQRLLTVKDRVRQVLLNMKADLRKGTPINVIEEFTWSLLAKLDGSSDIDEVRRAATIVYNTLTSDYPSHHGFLAAIKTELDILLDREEDAK